MPRIEHLVFDLDGTLYRQSEALENAIFDRMCLELADWMNKNKGSWTPSEIQSIYKEYYLQHRSHTEVFKEFGIPADEARKMSSTAFNSVGIEDYLGEDHELLTLFNQLDSRRLPYGLYTSSWTANAVAVLQKIGIRSLKRFAWDIYGEKFPKRAGTTKGFEEALRKSDEHLREKDEQMRKHHKESRIPCRKKPYTFTPKNVWYVGDRENLEIKPALNVGMSAVQVLWNPQAPQYEQKADDLYHVRDIYSLTQLVDLLLQPKSDKHKLPAKKQ